MTNAEIAEAMLYRMVGGPITPGRMLWSQWACAQGGRKIAEAIAFRNVLDYMGAR